MCVEEDTFPVALVVSLVTAAMLMTAGVTALYLHMKKKLELQVKETARLEMEKEERVQNKVKQGLETVKTLQHSMCLVTMCGWRLSSLRRTKISSRTMKV
jgi:hypothetical protein